MSSTELPADTGLRAEAESLRARGESWTLLVASPPSAPDPATVRRETLIAGRRAACLYRGEVRWGAWDAGRELVHLDSGPIVSVSGERLDPWSPVSASSILPWRDYWSRSRLFGWSAIALVPGTLVTFVLLRPTGWEVGLGGAAAPWIALVVLAALRYQSFACPRCGRAFHQTFWRHDPIASRCLHCGLAKWSDPDAPREPRS